MNQKQFEIFSSAYHDGLKKAVEKNPEQYYTRGASPEEYAETVSKKMLNEISVKPLGVNYSGNGFANACKTLGIKNTRKAIFSFLEIT